MEKQGVGRSRTFRKKKQRRVVFDMYKGASLSCKDKMEQNSYQLDGNNIKNNAENSSPKQQQPQTEEFSLNKSFRSFVQFISEGELMQKINLGFLLLFYCCCIVQSLNLLGELEKIGEYVEMGCQIVFIFYFIKRVFSCEKKYLLWIILDAMTIGSGCAAFFVNDEETYRYLKALRTLKLLFLLKHVENMKTPVLSCLRALKKAVIILLPAMCLIYVYAVVGLFSFVDYEYNKCRDPVNKTLKKGWSVYSEEIYLCGDGRSCPMVNGIQYECLNPLKYGVEPNPEEIYNLNQGYGFLTFSNIGYAFFTTFKNIFISGSTRSLVLYMPTLNSIYSAVYFYSFIYLMPYIYLNIFYGLLINSLSKELEENQQLEQQPIQEENSAEKKMRKFRVSIITRKSLFEKSERKIFIVEKPEIRVRQKKRTSFFAACQAEDSQQAPNNTNFQLHRRNLSDSSESKAQEKEKQQEETFQLYQKYFNIRKFFSGLNVIICTVILAIDFAHQSSQFEFVIDSIDCILLLWLILEIVAKIIYEVKYLGKVILLTKVDIGIMGFCLCGMIYEAIIATTFEEFVATENIVTSLIRNVKYLRLVIWILQVDFFSEEDKETLLCICRAVFAVRFFILVWFLIVSILAIMGFHLHHDKTLVDENGFLDLENGRPLQINSNGIYHSLIFTILTVYNEEWDIFMFQQYPGCKVMIIIWQLISMIIGFLLFSKYLMCLIVKQLDNILEKKELQKLKSNQIEQQNIIQSSQVQNKHCLRLNSIKPINNEKKQGEKNLQTEPNPCRTRLKELIKIIVDSCAFNFIKVVAILAVCTVTAVTNPTVSTSSTETEICKVITGLCWCIFLLQLLGISWVYGLWEDKENSYFKRSMLNYLNFIILLLEFMTLTPLSQFHLFYRVEKIRALRSVNLIQIQRNYDESMKIILRSLLKMIPKFLKLLVFLFVIYYFFALIFNKWHKNDFYYCENVPSSAKILAKQDCLSWGGDWLLANFNCQTSFHSFIYMFIVASMGGWAYQMMFTMNLNGEGNAPKYNQSEFNQIFFSIFFFVGNLIILNIFISLSLHNFKKLKDEETGFSNITDEEKAWLSVKLQITRMELKKRKAPPQSFIRNLAYRFCSHPSFNILKSFFFLFFLVTLSVESTYWKIDYRIWLGKLQQMFTYLTFIEYFIGLLAYGFTKKSKLIFQTLIAIYSLIFVIIHSRPETTQETARLFGAVFIVLQILRYISLLDQIPFTSRILNTLLTILPRSINIFLILLLYLYLSAIIGMELFAFLKPQAQLDGINQHYRNFPMALLSLIKFSILESLIGQISDSSHVFSPNFICFDISSYQDFEKYGFNGCGNPTASYVFFFSFHIFYTMFLMSTFIAFIVDTYSDIIREQESDITKHILNKVKDQWCEVDPEATGYINYRDFWLFSRKFMSIYKKQTKNQKEVDDMLMQKEKFMKRMNIRVYENEFGVLSFQFHEVIKALTKIYLEDSRGFKIAEMEEENPFENELRENLGVKITSFKSSDIQILIALKAGLKNWKHKTEQVKFYPFRKILDRRSFFNKNFYE